TMYPSDPRPTSPAPSWRCAEGAGLEPEPVANLSQRLAIVHLSLRSHPPPSERTGESRRLRVGRVSWRKVGTHSRSAGGPPVALARRTTSTRLEAGRWIVL